MFSFISVFISSQNGEIHLHSLQLISLLFDAKLTNSFNEATLYGQIGDLKGGGGGGGLAQTPNRLQVLNVHNF